MEETGGIRAEPWQEVYGCDAASPQPQLGGDSQEVMTAPAASLTSVSSFSVILYITHVYYTYCRPAWERAVGKRHSTPPLTNYTHNVAVPPAKCHHHHQSFTSYVKCSTQTKRTIHHQLSVQISPPLRNKYWLRTDIRLILTRSTKTHNAYKPFVEKS